jgi:hypothetical protein
MSKLVGRIDRLEKVNDSKIFKLFAWRNAGESAAAAEARYVAQHGPIPPGAELVLFEWAGLRAPFAM